jgi:hypothetical protein
MCALADCSLHALSACRKVPSDLSRMTILQRYLASIGVISLSNTRSGKYPSLGSGYPSSSSSQFFHSHTAQAAVAAAAAAAVGTRSSGKAARGAAVSPSPSHQYDMYDEEQQEHEQQLLQQQQQEYEQVLAYQQQHAATECEEDQQQHYGQQYGYEQQYSEHTAAAAAVGDAECEGAAAGLLQLARAALMHLEDEEDEEEADGSHAVKQEPDEADLQEEDAAGSGLARAQAQLRQLRASSSRQSGRHAAGSSQGGTWGKPELLPVVRSNSEDSDHTAEEEEGSPMAEANLKLQLQQALRPSSSSMGKGKRSPQGGSGIGGSSMPGSKRHRPMWQQPPSTAPGQPRLRPVLDVSSEPAASSYGGAHSLAAGEASPASPTPRSSSSPAAAAGSGSGVMGQPEPHAQLLALMMQAFMGAAAAGAASSGTEGQLPAAALSTNHLAAVARIMQLSGLASGPAAAAAGPAGTGSGAAAGGSTAVADMLAAMMQSDAAAGGAPAAAWSTTLEQYVRAAAGQ